MLRSITSSQLLLNKSTQIMDFLGLSSQQDTSPIQGSSYIQKLHKYLKANLPRLVPPTKTSSPSLLSQSYTLLTLGLDPNSAPLSRNLKVPLTLGFGTPSPPKVTTSKPLILRLPPDRLLYLLLRWQSLPQALPYVGRTDVPISPGVPVAARGARVDAREVRGDGDVQSVRSWVGSMRSVSMGSVPRDIPGMGWFKKKEEVDEDQTLLALYQVFSILPSLLIHPPFTSDLPILDLLEAGGYTQLGGIDVRVPLDVLRNLKVLELESYDPRGLLIPPIIGLRSLAVKEVQDADDWIEELLKDGTEARFPNLRYLSLHSTTLLSFPTLPLSNLTNLDLSSNLLNSIPTSLATLHNLQSINLSNNVITSLRNAPQVLGNITSLNLSKNRIDCLVGLERVLGLQRVDVRGNLLEESSEIGRLAVLPHIKEIWCTGNPFDQPLSAGMTGGDEWRIELGVSFAAEGRDVVLDDQVWTWSESRKIEGLLAARGGVASHSREQSAAGARQSGSIRSTMTISEQHPHLIQSPTTSLPSPSFPSPTTDHPEAHSSPSSNRSPRNHGKRKPRRRVVDLDDTNTNTHGDNSEDGKGSPEPFGGSLRVPTGKVNGEGSLGVKVGKSRRARVSASMFEPLSSES